MGIWRFPEIGVPPNHPFLDGIFAYKPTSYCGTPMIMETPMISVAKTDELRSSYRLVIGSFFTTTTYVELSP